MKALNRKLFYLLFAQGFFKRGWIKDSGCSWTGSLDKRGGGVGGGESDIICEIKMNQKMLNLFPHATSSDETP